MQHSVILQHRRAGKAGSTLPAHQGSRIELAAFLLTIFAHAVLIFSLARETEPPAPSAARILHARLSAPTAEPAPPAQSTPQPASPREAPLLARKLEAVAPEPAQPIPLPALPTQPAPALEDDPYFTPRQLTLKPRLLPEMESQMELQLQDVEPQILILRLFINEEGGVDKVALEQARLSAGSAALIQVRFSGIKFYPGEINGQPVKSQLKLEVKLENALPPLPGRRG